MAKKKRDRCLTELTFFERREWIKKESPFVSDIIRKFPSLKLRKVVWVQLALLCIDIPLFRTVPKRVQEKDVSIISMMESWIVAVGEVEQDDNKV